MEGHQRRGIAHAGRRPYQRLNFAEDRAAHANANRQRKYGYRGEPRRLGEHPQRIAYVLPDLAKIHRGQLHGDIGEQPQEPGQTVTARDVRNGVLTQPVEIFSI